MSTFVRCVLDLLMGFVSIARTGHVYRTYPSIITVIQPRRPSAIEKDYFRNKRDISQVRKLELVIPSHHFESLEWKRRGCTKESNCFDGPRYRLKVETLHGNKYGRLCIRKDRPVYVDVGLQEELFGLECV
ncbi:unnamed protein product [Albugo candida]|uniref:CFA20 domain-containing protein n=1 Tax=Albugo candida TaxID=65357 RepID=A0A024GSC2_9STRA|nr:unnamed protein product [Albugo candida]|eukprot:CCI49693.1 unnamed protein product [Albugo candida]